MIETEQRVLIEAPIDKVWTYARDIEGWSRLMPGLRECNVIDDHNSRWVLKVGVGGLVRTVTVLVHVDEWAGPGSVVFTYVLAGDPVGGGGQYVARCVAPGLTEVTLQVRVVGEGSMAAMWEAMGKPLLPQLARTFAMAFKAEIEGEPGAVPSDDAEAVPLWLALFQPLIGVWRKLLRSRFTEKIS